MSADSVGVRGFAIASAFLDEAGFTPGLEEILRAVVPGMAQFPQARIVFTSSPGAPEGPFHDLVSNRNPTTIVFRAPTWVTNPRITEAHCRELAGDDTTFEIEFAARRFGYSGEAWIDLQKALPAVGSLYAGKGPRAGHFVIGVDIAQLVDQTVIIVVSSFETALGPNTAPIRHVVVEHVEVIASSRTRPTSIEQIAARVVELSGQYRDAPVCFDPFQGPTVKDAFRKLGFAEHEGTSSPSRKRFLQCSMAPQEQTPRWKLVRDLVNGGRLHIVQSPGGETLARQLGQLRATQLSSGALKIEGKVDDAADAFALAAPIAVKLPPTSGPEGVTSMVTSNVFFEHGVGLHVKTQFVRTLPNGQRIDAECPRWSPRFPLYALEMLEQGRTTRAIDLWLEEVYAIDPVTTSPFDAYAKVKEADEANRQM
jgi:hypothetical protein